MRGARRGETGPRPHLVQEPLPRANELVHRLGAGGLRHVGEAERQRDGEAPRPGSLAGRPLGQHRHGHPVGLPQREPHRRDHGPVAGVHDGLFDGRVVPRSHRQGLPEESRQHLRRRRPAQLKVHAAGPRASPGGLKGHRGLVAQQREGGVGGPQASDRDPLPGGMDSPIAAQEDRRRGLELTPEVRVLGPRSFVGPEHDLRSPPAHTVVHDALVSRLPAATALALDVTSLLLRRGLRGS
mmetsp:Transcript_17401/g.48079  ORF Transcript_17401/g.48079 Transcript_17401/m.48079 type:complete len:240 (+) Transcript_17401:106-825(+)